MFSRENISRLHQESQQKLQVAKRAQLLEEYKLKIWDRDEYIAQLAILDGKQDDALPAPKRQNTRAYSPDWDLTDFQGSSQSFNDI
jgi:hypothetical protein